MTSLATFEPGWYLHMHPGSSLHYVAALSSLALTLLLVLLGRRWRNTSKGRSLEVLFAASIAAVQLFSLIWRLLPAHYTLADSLPLQLCRIVPWIAMIAVLTRARFAIALTFFWGLGLSSMGLITPVIRTGIDGIEFWLFWLAHFQIVAAAAYPIFVDGWGPRFPDLRLILLANTIYAIVLVPINLGLGTDYSFLGSGEYDRTTLAGYLGEFPLRVAIIWFLAQLWMIVLFAFGRGVGFLKHTSRKPQSVAA